MRRKILVTVVAVLVVAGLGAVGLNRLRQGRLAAQRNLQTAEVQRGSLVATVNTAGTVQAPSTVNLTFQVAGQVEEIRVKEGDRVKAGQVLAVLDSADLELQAANAEASLKISQARLEQAKRATPGDLAAAEASLASARASYEAARTKAGLNDAQLTVARTALDKATIAVQDAQGAYDRVSWRPGASALPQAKTLQQATIDYESAKANYELQVASINDTAVKSAYAQLMSVTANLTKLKAGNTSTDLTIAEAQTQQAEISLQQAKNKVAQTRLVAPFDGTVTRFNLLVGQMVNASTQVGSLADLGVLEVVADMSEVDVARISAGQEVDIALDALADRTFKGHVSKVALAGTTVQGVVNYPVAIRLDRADAAIKPGMTANASIVVDRRDNVLLVPSRAVRSQSGRRYVRVLFKGQTIEMPVQVGLSGDGGVEILTDPVAGETIKEGDVLVLNVTTTQQRGLSAARPGMMMMR